MSIIISQDGKKAQKIDKQEIEKENYLQKYIHENPESIPVYEIEEDKKLLVVAREFRTESGPIDALAVDQDGDIYVVETKLYKNPDKRTVVAQALDYGASLWRHSNFDEFMAKVNNELTSKFNMDFVGKMKDFFSIDDERITLASDSIKRNLQDGNIKFVILMDSVEDRLKDLIVYVNQNSQFDIYAVQMEYYKFEKYEIIIPKLFGVEVKKSVSTNPAVGARKKWDEQGFFIESSARLSAGMLSSLKEIYIFSKSIASNISWGTGASRPSFQVKVDRISNKALYGVNCEGKLSIFQWPNDTKEAEKFREKLKISLNNSLPNWHILEDSDGQSVKIDIEQWAGHLDVFKKAVNESLK
ncbi:MAG: hypothetical protein M0R32_10720 [Candidatus Cloacimonetes bacterium]|jgi:hypothetical protein|nr:hypothetical protein [Candidatus Cloacimonadota bacterium]